LDWNRGSSLPALGKMAIVLISEHTGQSYATVRNVPSILNVFLPIVMNFFRLVIYSFPSISDVANLVQSCTKSTTSNMDQREYILSMS
jgi:hypothetical protein